MIYTLDYLEKEAEGIQGAWNGSDDKFNYEGDLMTEDDVNVAEELQVTLAHVRALVKELGI